MKKHRFKLSILFIAIGLALTACNLSSGGSSNTPDQRQQIYAAYVSSGGELSYEEWLTSIKGADGSSLLYGESQPNIDLGNNGDTFINIATWDIYVKTGGSWAKVGNIMGAQGQQGPIGPQGPQGETGPQGPAGQDGQNGKDGRSVVSINLTSSNGNVDTYTITYSDGTTSTFTVTNGVNGQDGGQGVQGEQGIQGNPGQDGHTPVITIGNNGHWFVDGEDTGIAAQGPQGPAGQDGVSVISIEKTSTDGLVDTYTITYSDGSTSTFTVTNGVEGPIGPQGIQGNPGQDGHTPVITIGSNGHWFVDGVDTGIAAQGPQGETGPQGPAGQDGQNGKDGRSVVSINLTSSNGNVDTYTITYSDGTTSTFTVTNGVNGQDGGQGVQGEQGIQGNPGQDGHTPVITIGNNGHWFVDGEDTGIAAQGPQGPIGPQGPQGPAGQDGVSVISIEKTSTDGLVDTYTITYSDGSTSTFTVTNGVEGPIGPQGIQGNPGQDGHTPVITIGSNGHWFVDGVDTGIAAQGPQGETGPQGPAGQDGVSIINTYVDDNGDLIIVYSNGTTSNAGHISNTNKYTVNFYVDDSLYCSLESFAGSLLSKPNNPQKQCKNFVGWFDENGDKWVFNAFTINKDINLYAKFEDNHTFNHKVTSDEYCIKKTTCEEPGLYYFSCECGECGTDTFEVPATGHHFNHGYCWTEDMIGCNKAIYEVLKNDLGQNYFTKINQKRYGDFYNHVWLCLIDAYMNRPTMLERITIDLGYEFPDFSFEEATTIAAKAIIDNPLCYFAPTSFTYDSIEKNLYINVPEEYKELSNRNMIQDEIEQFLTECPIKYGDSQIDIVTKAHDYIIDRVDYEYDSSGKPSEEPYAHNILGVVEGKGAVCEGYAKTFQMLCTYFNIPCYVVTGKTDSGENHAWNLVQVNDEWYWCDLTWDDLETEPILDSIWSDGGSYYSRRYSHFLVSDKDFCDTHIIGTTFSETEMPFVYELPSRSKKNYYETHDKKQSDYLKIDGIYYEMVDSFSVSVVYIDKEGDVTIPSVIEYEQHSYNVVSIGGNSPRLKLNDEQTLYSNTTIVAVGPNVSSITIPSSIKTIYMHSLTSLAGSNLIKHPNNCYQNHLTNIYVADDNEYFCSVDGVLYTKDKTYLVAYPFEKEDETYVVDDNVLSMDTNAFAGFSHLKDLYFGKNFLNYRCIQHIPPFLRQSNGKIHFDEDNPYFYDYDGFVYRFEFDDEVYCLLCASDTEQESYTILGSIDKNGTTYYVTRFNMGGFSGVDSNGIFHGVNDSVFRQLVNATSFNIQNDMFIFKDGVLWYADNYLYATADTKELVFSSEFSNELGNFTFKDDDVLEKIIISDGITTIGIGAFYGCEKLTTVVIPVSVVLMNQYPFALCPNLTDIYYEGTMEQWNAIAKHDSWDTDVRRATIHCIDGDIVFGYESAI